MRKDKIKKGMLVRPSKNKRSKTRFWQLQEYKGKVVGFANSFYIEVNWTGFISGTWKSLTFKSLMLPVDIEPY